MDAFPSGRPAYDLARVQGLIETTKTWPRRGWQRANGPPSKDQCLGELAETIVIPWQGRLPTPQRAAGRHPQRSGVDEELQAMTPSVSAADSHRGPSGSRVQGELSRSGT